MLTYYDDEEVYDKDMYVLHYRNGFTGSFKQLYTTKDKLNEKVQDLLAQKYDYSGQQGFKQWKSFYVTRNDELVPPKKRGDEKMENEEIIKQERPGLIPLIEDELYHQLHEQIINQIKTRVYDYGSKVFLAYPDYDLEITVKPDKEHLYGVLINGLPCFDDELVQLLYSKIIVKTVPDDAYPMVSIQSYPQTKNHIADLLDVYDEVRLEEVEPDKEYVLHYMGKEYKLLFEEQYDRFRDEYVEVLVLPDEIHYSRIRDIITVYLEDEMEMLSSKINYYII